MLHGARQILAHRAHRHRHAFRDLAVPQPFQLRQQKRLAHLGGQPVKQAVDFQQRFQCQGAAFGRRRVRVLNQRQAVQIGTFDIAAAKQVHHQAVSNGRQIGARLAQDARVVLADQHFQVGVVGQVGCIEWAARLPAQPVAQPGLMLNVEPFDGGRRTALIHDVRRTGKQIYQ
ncbi:hypothetical protein D3C86_1684280 [compost metagenome]